jgi:hypothetical protein
MQRYIFPLVLFFSSYVFAAPLQDRRIEPAALSELTSALGIPADANLVEETQKRWLRRSGTERWEQTEISAEQRQQVLSWGQKQGFFSDWLPSQPSYDSALILGATTVHMQMRLGYLVKLWEKGTRFKEVVWLTGDRPLDKRVDGLTDRCANESEASHILWEEAKLPEEMRALPVRFVAVPMKGEKRPNTEDTIVAWLETKPSAQKTLFVSDQPFCGYQFAVVKGCLPDAIDFDLVGKGADPSSHPLAAAITLDSIARWLYEEEKLK